MWRTHAILWSCVSGRVVVEIRAEPFLGLGDGPAPSARVVHDLVPADLTDTEVLRIQVVEVPAGHAACGRHGAALRQPDSGGGLRAKKVEEDGLLAVVGAGGISGGGADAAVAFAEQILMR